MGLDSYWVKNGKPCPLESHPTFNPPLRLCGGLMSGNGMESFRGKVYNDQVEAATGVSLYQELIPNYVVKEMADKLDVCHFYDEMQDLKRMFRTYADAGFDLAGWW